MTFLEKSLLVLFVALALVAPRVARAGSNARAWTVNSPDDDQSDGCGTAVGDCTLREAIEAATARAGRDAIYFDPQVFSREAPNPIVLQAGLPPLVEPVGAIVSGVGAHVVIDGGNLQADELALVVSSGPGRPLEHATITDLTIRGFASYGLLVCGGPYELSHNGCDQDVEDTRIKRVHAEFNERSGIFVTGAANRRTVIEYSSSRENGSGIDVNASRNQALVRAVVKHSTAVGNQSRGINLNASGDTYRATVHNCIATGNGDPGININSGGRNRESRVLASSSFSNQSTGIALNAALESGVFGADVRDNHAGGNRGVGIWIDHAVRSNVQDNRVTANSDGIELDHGPVRTRVWRNVSTANTGTGIEVYDGGTNQIVENVSRGNGWVDMADDHADCGSNRWRSNRFGTADRQCIR